MRFCRQIIEARLSPGIFVKRRGQYGGRIDRAIRRLSLKCPQEPHADCSAPNTARQPLHVAEDTSGHGLGVLYAEILSE